MGHSMTPQEFIQKWASVTLGERQAAQEHFYDLCHLLNHQTPAEADPHGEWFAMEKGAEKTTGGWGWADAWKRDCFAWEYKTKDKHKDLHAAYAQLLQYREDLLNPPLLVVCDIGRYEVHTNFTGTAKRVYAFTNEELDRYLGLLERVFTNPDSLRPDQTVETVTQQAAERFGELADGLREQYSAEDVGQLLMKLLFCAFAEDIGLLPNRVFTRIVRQTLQNPPVFRHFMGELFEAMRGGGWALAEEIPHFDGGLFENHEVLPLGQAQLYTLYDAVRLDWSSVEPAIFGTLFERIIDPDKTHQRGRVYTEKEDIHAIVTPVLIQPLQEEWEAVKDTALRLTAERDLLKTESARNKRNDQLVELLYGFADKLTAITVLDPACGSGNFLYVSLNLLKGLEKEVLKFGVGLGISMPPPRVAPEQLHGIEISPYAVELASVVVWIGHIQWRRANGFFEPETPILRPIKNITLKDAVLQLDGGPQIPEWPEATVIVGNPPFIGDKRMREELGDEYVEVLRNLYADRIPGASDYVCYWFERAREQIVNGHAQRAGLIATQAIRGGANRVVLERINEETDIFFAIADRNWAQDGVNVHVSMVGFGHGDHEAHLLDGRPVDHINPDLTGHTDVTQAQALAENKNLAFIGVQKSGSFDIVPEVAEQMLAAPVNPNGRSNSDVVVPWMNGQDITQQARGMWIIDFGVDMSENEAAYYELPFEYVKANVKPERLAKKENGEYRISRTHYRERWWLFGETRPGMRAALAPLHRYICTPRVSKHRVFVWLPPEILPDSATVAIAREDDYFFGVLHSAAHEIWSLRQSTQLREKSSGNRYTPTTAFETFPFPWPPGQEPTDDHRYSAIASAARELNEKRDFWLRGAVETPGGQALRKSTSGVEQATLTSRTLTDLYNKLEANEATWLANLHNHLDQAVFDAYGWEYEIDDDEILARLLALNAERRPVE